MVGQKKTNVFLNSTEMLNFSNKKGLKPYIFPKLKIIIPVFNVLYVRDDSLFGPAAAAPFKAQNIPVIRKEHDTSCGGKKKLLKARNY